MTHPTDGLTEELEYTKHALSQTISERETLRNAVKHIETQLAAARKDVATLRAALKASRPCVVEYGMRLVPMTLPCEAAKDVLALIDQDHSHRT